MKPETLKIHMNAVAARVENNANIVCFDPLLQTDVKTDVNSTNIV